MNNIEAYKELEQELASSFEVSYQSLVFQGEYKQAYELLGKMMAYKLISKSDERLQTKYFNKFKKAGIDKEHRFRKDLRSNTNFIPDWLFSDLPYNLNTTLNAVEYLGHRVEYTNDVTTIYPARSFQVGINLISIPKTAYESILDMNTIVKDEIRKSIVGIDNLAKEAEAGYSRVYKIEITDSVVSKYRVLGYVLLVRNNTKGTYLARYILKSKVFNHYYIPIADAYKIIGKTIQNELKLNAKLEVQPLINYGKAVERQKGAMAINREKLNKLLKGQPVND